MPRTEKQEARVKRLKQNPKVDNPWALENWLEKRGKKAKKKRGERTTL